MYRNSDSSYSRIAWHKVKLDFLTLYSMKSFLFYIFIFVFSAVIVALFLIPFYNVGGIQIGFAVDIPLMIILGGISYNWKKSTLGKNEKIGGYSSRENHTPTILFLLIIGNALFLILLIINLFLGSLGLLKGSYVWDNVLEDRLDRLHWENVNWFNIFYAVEINIFVSYFVYFLFYKLFYSVKTYFIFVLVLFILFIMFGAAFNDYSESTKTETSGSTLVTPAYNAVLFPDVMFIPSLFFPFYGAAQFYQSAVQRPLADYGNMTSSNYAFRIFTNDSKAWTAIVLQPWIVMTTFFMGGTLTTKFKDNK